MYLQASPLNITVLSVPVLSCPAGQGRTTQDRAGQIRTGQGKVYEHKVRQNGSVGQGKLAGDGARHNREALYIKMYYKIFDIVVRESSLVIICNR